MAPRERMVSYRLILGESSDKPLESGVSVFTEMVNLIPLIPADDTNGGVQTVPGWRIYGESSFTFVPGVDPEDGIAGGEPSATPEESTSYKRLVDYAFVCPELEGTVFLGVYSSNGTDAETGRVAYVYQEQWGNETPSAGDRSDPLPARTCDLDISTVAAPTIPSASYPAVPTSAYTLVFSNADVDVVAFDIYTGSTSGALELVDADIPNEIPGDEITRDLTTLFPYDIEEGSFTPGTYYYRVVGKDADGCEVSTPEYEVAFESYFANGFYIDLSPYKVWAYNNYVDPSQGGFYYAPFGEPPDSEFFDYMNNPGNVYVVAFPEDDTTVFTVGNAGSPPDGLGIAVSCSIFVGSDVNSLSPVAGYQDIEIDGLITVNVPIQDIIPSASPGIMQTGIWYVETRYTDLRGWVSAPENRGAFRIF